MEAGDASSSMKSPVASGNNLVSDMVKSISFNIIFDCMDVGLVTEELRLVSTDLLAV